MRNNTRTVSAGLTAAAIIIGGPTAIAGAQESAPEAPGLNDAAGRDVTAVSASEGNLEVLSNSEVAEVTGEEALNLFGIEIPDNIGNIVKMIQDGIGNIPQLMQNAQNFLKGLGVNVDLSNPASILDALKNNPLAKQITNLIPGLSGILQGFAGGGSSGGNTSADIGGNGGRPVTDTTTNPGTGTGTAGGDNQVSTPGTTTGGNTNTGGTTTTPNTGDQNGTGTGTTVTDSTTTTGKDDTKPSTDSDTDDKVKDEMKDKDDTKPSTDSDKDEAKDKDEVKPSADDKDKGDKATDADKSKDDDGKVTKTVDKVTRDDLNADKKTEKDEKIHLSVDTAKKLVAAARTIHAKTATTLSGIDREGSSNEAREAYDALMESNENLAKSADALDKAIEAKDEAAIDKHSNEVNNAIKSVTAQTSALNVLANEDKTSDAKAEEKAEDKKTEEVTVVTVDENGKVVSATQAQGKRTLATTGAPALVAASLVGAAGIAAAAARSRRG